MEDNIKGIEIIDEGIDAVSGGVLYAVFVADSFPERMVIVDFIPYILDLFDQIPMGFCKRTSRLRNSGIKPRTITEDDPHAFNGLIAVLRSTAAHAACVIRCNTANHAAVY
jgi:hypothetical protein